MKKILDGTALVKTTNDAFKEVAGSAATDYLVDKTRKEIIGDGHASLLTLSIYVSATFTSIEGYGGRSY